jgi:hypothetical protein
MTQMSTSQIVLFNGTMENKHHPSKLQHPRFDEKCARAGEFELLTYLEGRLTTQQNRQHCFEFMRHGRAFTNALTEQDVSQNLEERCYLGATMLHYACAANSVESARLLIETGADIDAEWCFPSHFDPRQAPSEFVAPAPWTPLQICREMNHDKIERMLERCIHKQCTPECKTAMMCLSKVQWHSRTADNKVQCRSLVLDTQRKIAGMLFDKKKWEYLMRDRMICY